MAYNRDRKRTSQASSTYDTVSRSLESPRPSRQAELARALPALEDFLTQRHSWVFDRPQRARADGPRDRPRLMKMRSRMAPAGGLVGRRFESAAGQGGAIGWPSV